MTWLPDTARLLIATPVDGTSTTAKVAYGYMVQREAMVRRGALTVAASFGFSDDIARARSRVAHVALARAGWTHLLWWDDDVVPEDISIVSRMIATGHDVVGAPYPRKRIQAAFPYQPLESSRQTGTMHVEGDCAEVASLAFGFMLTTRAALERMTIAYESEWFTDVREDQPPSEVVAMFRQVMTETQILPGGKRFRTLLSEDYSFCHRWRAIGGTVQMYVGVGAPLGHVGGHMFTGRPDEMGSVL
jgi:hypothetical protein